MISDQENNNTFKRMTLGFPDMSYGVAQHYTNASTGKHNYKNRRDQLIKELIVGINKQREGTQYKPITPRWLAIKCNSNPFLKSDDELELVKKECESKGNYKKLFWVLKG